MPVLANIKRWVQLVAAQPLCPARGFCDGGLRTMRPWTHRQLLSQGALSLQKEDERVTAWGGDPSWQGYEELVKDIYEALGQATGVEIECWGNSCRVEGPPGVFHQIDVLTRHSDGIHQYRTAISCKNWNKRVGLAVVRELVQILEGTNLNKGVIVSKMGFTRFAKKHAKSHGVGLVELRRPSAKDWEGSIREVQGSIVFERMEIYDVRFSLTAPEQDSGEEAYRGGPIRWSLFPSQISINSPGQQPRTLQEIADEEWGRDPERGHYEVPLPRGSVLTVPATRTTPPMGVR